MKLVARYRQHAEDCEHRARHMKSEVQRKALLRIAASWRALADEREDALAGGLANHPEGAVAALLHNWEIRRS